MDLVKWSPDLETDITWQDYQHCELLEAIHKLHSAIAENSTEVIEEIVDFLEGYVRSHFGIEEKYMELYDYPGTQEHIERHDIFRSNLAEIAAQDRTKKLQAMKLCYDLNEWLVQHIVTQDRQLAAFLKPKS